MFQQDLIDLELRPTDCSQHNDEQCNLQNKTYRKPKLKLRKKRNAEKSRGSSIYNSQLTQSELTQKSYSRQNSTQQIIKSLKRLIKPKNTNFNPKLTQKDQIEIESIINKKVKHFHSLIEAEFANKPLTPYNNAKLERIRRMNVQKEQKIERIKKQQLDEEIVRKKKAAKLKKQSLTYNATSQLVRKLHKLSQQHKMEQHQIDKSYQERNQKDKSLLIDNIQNYYDSKIQELKEKLEVERLTSRTIMQEKKAQSIRNKKTKKLLQKQYHSRTMNKIEKSEKIISIQIPNRKLFK